MYFEKQADAKLTIAAQKYKFIFLINCLQLKIYPSVLIDVLTYIGRDKFDENLNFQIM